VVAAWTELPPSGGLSECAALVDLAERLRWSAPELVVQYAGRALAESGTAEAPVVVRAQALVSAALVRVGRYADAVAPALAALRSADQVGRPEFALAIRLDLAVCAKALNEPLLGCAIVRPVLESTAARPAVRADAIATLVGCAEHVGRRDDLEDLLAEAERLLAADETLGPDARRIERALLSVQTAAYHRRYGDTEDAVEAAQSGLGLLTKLRDRAFEGGRVRLRLILELVCALLDEGELTEAMRVAGPVLGEPIRAASADPAGRLLLAVATRVALPGGKADHGRELLGQVTRIAERHGLDWLLADALTVIANLDEVACLPVDALAALRGARAAEDRQRRSADAAKRQLMIEFGARELSLDTVNSLLRSVVRSQVGSLVREPTVREPIGREPVAREPLGRESLLRDPSAREPGLREPVVREPVARDAVAREASGQGSGRELSSREPVVREPVVSPPAPEPPETDAATGLLTREGLSRRLQAVRSGNRPVALTLVRLEPVDTDPAPIAETAPDAALTTLAGRVRDIAPLDAELARSAGSELAVLLPHTTRDEAEEFAATIRESAIESDWLVEASISTGVAQSGMGTPEDADSLLTAARETLTPAESPQPEPTADEGPSRYQEIRDLLAPLLGHPTLTRAPRQTVPPVPEPEEVPDPPQRREVILPTDPDTVPPIPHEPEPAPEVPPPAGEPEPEPDKETGWQARLDALLEPSVADEESGSIAETRSQLAQLGESVPAQPRTDWEPDSVAETREELAKLGQAPEPVAEQPIPEPQPVEEPPPPAETVAPPPPPVELEEPEPVVAEIPDEPTRPELKPVTDQPTDELRRPTLQAIFQERTDLAEEPSEPVEDPEPPKPLRRRERSDAASIAELLTEALVAYQATEEEEPTPIPEPEPVAENTPPAQRDRIPGRHRMPDWDSV
jgi:GGDEF domain-containing protein